MGHSLYMAGKARSIKGLRGLQVRYHNASILGNLSWRAVYISYTVPQKGNPKPHTLTEEPLGQANEKLCKVRHAINSFFTLELPKIYSP